ncbi:hypothetical protein [Desulfosporosinus sp. Sb-LF]|uniref:hypothetical protein n=1 Tax=Desulfosporosinus sp. Sb-LF TaxID=2560027 RepID=UPI00107EED68|nr:hypothetical protein [Desulfosporosinus sp. Sb-LF]TGE34478.1 hypothetical protein E4K68_01970 [Desulfosporosinus sp. Sb-LF]
MEKRILEKSAIDLFISCFKETYGMGYRLVLQQERPDAIVVDESGRRLGIEVTYLFYDVTEAKMLLGRSEQQMHGLENFDCYIKVLNSLLEKKSIAGRGYSTEYPCSLLIRNSSPIWAKEDFCGAISRIKVPINQYKNIWLLTRDRFSAWGLIRLE